jgi:uncharacterized membrane protein
MPSRDFSTAPSRGAHDAGNPAAAAFDPLRFCIFTTVALLAWIAGAAFTVMVMSGLGIVAYGRAMRAGLTSSRCVLGDTRLVMLYLGVAFISGAAGVVRAIAGALR